MTENGTVLAACVSIVNGDEILIIQEHTDKWNFPGGRLEAGESVMEAACREVREETGFDVKLTGTTGVYQFRSSRGSPVLLVHFTGEITGGTWEPEDNVVGLRWITASGLLDLKDLELREGQAIRQMAVRLIRKEIYPATLYCGL